MIEMIMCPKCGHQFSAEEALLTRIEEKVKADFSARLKAREEELRTEMEYKLKAEREIINSSLDEERKKLKMEVEEEQSEKLKYLEKQLEERSSEVKSLRQKEIELLERENKLNEQKEEMDLEIKKKVLEQQQSIENQAREKERERQEMEKNDLRKQLEDQKIMIEEMKKRAEQGSMQLQGDAQEIALEDLLRNAFLFDQIEPVKTGVRGADCIQTVIDEFGKKCGTIVYESKRTKSFNQEWIGKLKQDQIASKSDLAVLVTETLPPDMVRFGLRDNVWICTFPEVKSLATALRQILIRSKEIEMQEENKGERMELLYRYLTSAEFVAIIERIVETYNDMQSQLDSEKRSMQRLWKAREKQIELVQENIGSLFGSIRGIAGNQLPATKLLELTGEGMAEKLIS